MNAERLAASSDGSLNAMSPSFIVYGGQAGNVLIAFKPPPPLLPDEYLAP